ncbi:hypothetical protein [Arthrobacter sp. efr-133-R2A-63]|uniref:hypothetical protein n=1 Tax=Arthrobacter sp. efr-133-R2A-63 TaxID=3040278 RepID=UPI00254C0C39|nr:hypothetical protein [Arthrobacter sp. efr-133-R2A-63]
MTETDRAKNRAGVPDYGVYGAEDFKVKPHPSIPYAVIVTKGKAHGWGVTDEAATDQVVQCDAISSGTRYDLIVDRRNWQPAAGGPSTLVAIPGGATPEIPAARKIGPGVEDDQPLALVEWNGGLSAPNRIIDLRVWAGNGGLYAKDDLVRTYLTGIGTEVNINGTVWSLQLGDNNLAVWVKKTPGAKVYVASSWMAGAIPISTSPDGNNIKLATISIPDPGFPYHVQVQARFEGGKSATRWDANISMAGQPWLAVAALGNTVAPWYDISGFTTNPVSGPSSVDLNLVRLYGTESFGLTAFNRAFRAMVVPAAL